MPFTRRAATRRAATRRAAKPRAAKPRAATRRAASRRVLAAMIATSFVAATVTISGPAIAQTEEPPPSLVSDRGGLDRVGLDRVGPDRVGPDPSTEGLEPAAAGLVTGRVLYRTLANLTPRPLESGYVTFYRLNTLSGNLELEDSTFTFDADGDWSKAGLPAGTYTVSYIQGGEAPSAREWYNDERDFRNADTFELVEGAPLTLPTVTLQPRGVEMGRYFGADRFETNVALTSAAFPVGGAVNVVIVNGLDYPDALSAGPLANSIGAAMLMVTPTSIPSVIAAELTRLDPNHITIVGGTGVVSEAVEAQLAAWVSNPDTQLRRISGADRYATSRAVLEEGFYVPIETVLLATGRNFPDALAAGPAAGYTNGAVLLVNGSAGTLDAPTSALIDDLDAPTYVIGGTGSISTGIELAAEALGLDVARVAGVDRYQTSIRIGSRFFFYADVALLVNGSGFADALSAAPIGGQIGAPVYLSTRSCIPDAVFDELIAVLANEIGLVGGAGVLSPAVESFTSCNGRSGPALLY